MLTEVESRYLIAIYEEHLSGYDAVGPKRLAERMQVKRPTAYEMLNKLRAKGMIERRNGKYSLTENGMEIAKKVIRSHRIIETLLYNAGVELEKACKMAYKIQTEFEDDVIDILCEYLGNPKKCPHGKPIPG